MELVLERHPNIRSEVGALGIVYWLDFVLADQERSAVKSECSSSKLLSNYLLDPTVQHVQ